MSTMGRVEIMYNIQIMLIFVLSKVNYSGLELLLQCCSILSKFNWCVFVRKGSSKAVSLWNFYYHKHGRWGIAQRRMLLSFALQSNENEIDSLLFLRSILLSSSQHQLIRRSLYCVTFSFTIITPLACHFIPFEV